MCSQVRSSEHLGHSSFNFFFGIGLADESPADTLDIGDEAYHARFPFVRLDQTGRPVRAIKPLNLAQEDATRLFDHGWEWVGRVRKLRKNNQLPDYVLFATQRPEDAFGPRATAYAEVKEELERLDVKVTSAGEERPILEFALGTSLPGT